MNTPTTKIETLLILMIFFGPLFGCGGISDNREAELSRREADLAQREAELAKKEEKVPPANKPDNSRPSSADIKIIGVKSNKAKDKIPQIAGAATSQQKEFNEFVKRQVTGDYSGYEVSYVSPEFISLYLIDEFCGASCHSQFIPVNFDLEAGGSIDLGELFKPGSGYLKKIASYCVRELNRTWECNDPESFRAGTSATADNYKIWRLSRKGIEIIFPQYQLGAGACGGASVVVPFSQLKGMLREDVGFLRSF